MDNSYEGSEGEDTDEDELLALGELEFEEHGEGGDDTMQNHGLVLRNWNNCAEYFCSATHMITSNRIVIDAMLV